MEHHFFGKLNLKDGCTWEAKQDFQNREIRLFLWALDNALITQELLDNLVSYYQNIEFYHKHYCDYFWGYFREKNDYIVDLLNNSNELYLSKFFWFNWWKVKKARLQKAFVGIY